MITAPEIRVARAWLNEDQITFARRFGVHQSTISRWEKIGPPQDGPFAVLIKHVLAEIETDK
jgi:DNA-binding transcriptional regulator YiaG